MTTARGTQVKKPLDWSVWSELIKEKERTFHFFILHIRVFQIPGTCFNTESENIAHLHL